MNSATIKKNREKLFDYFSLMTYKQVLNHWKVSIEELPVLMKKRRNIAILASIFTNSRTTTLPDSICWYCKHATNRYGECSWSDSLTPRKDWDENSYDVTDDGEDGKGIRVKNCKGFEVDTDSSMSRKTLEIIFTDFFGDSDGFLNRRYFAGIDNDVMAEWLDIYNSISEMAGLSALTMRRVCADVEE